LTALRGPPTLEGVGTVRIALAASLVALVSLAARSAPGSEQLIVSATDAPQTSGEIFRVTLAGQQTNLTHSPYDDTQPVASTDGSKVAFISDRDGSSDVWAINADGSGLTQLSSDLGLTTTPIAWSPDGTRFLASALDVRDSGALWVLEAGQPQRRISRVWPQGVTQAAWSHDGREIAYVAMNLLTVTTTDGRQVLAPDETVDWFAWSARGPLALHTRGTGVVYTPGGKPLARFAAKALAWSPDGMRLASVHAGFLELRSTAGKLVFRKRIAAHDGYAPQLLWSGPDRVLVSSPSTIAVDVRNGKVSPVSPGAFLADSCNCSSPDGSLVVQSIGTTLQVSRASGGGGRTLVHVPACRGDEGSLVSSARSPAFAGNDAVVYGSVCGVEPANLWLTDTAGSAPRRITNEQAVQMQPAWAADGSEFAYAQMPGGGCAGCSESIWVRSADGSSPRQLTTPPSDVGSFDEHPTFSPDGKTILFQRGGVDETADPPKLFTAPAAGGATKALGIVGREPVWGPSRIAYVGLKGNLYTAAPDGTGVTKVLDSPYLLSPAWSRDGSLAVVETTSAETRFTAVVVTDGRVTRAALPFGDVRSLSWTADGAHLLVVASKGAFGHCDLWTVNPDGTDATQLTSDLDVLAASAS
jgi:Tol biopolymer transport system component